MNEEVDPMRHQQQPTMSSSRSTLPAALVEQLLNSMDVRIEAFAICRLGLNSTLAIPAVPELKIIYRSVEHTSELQSLMRTSYAVLCLKKKKSSITKPQH